MNTLLLVIAWIITIFIAYLQFILLFFIITGRINITKLISDENGDASLSRFQFLILNLVIAASLFYLVISRTPPAFPEIPSSILVLLGISGSIYLISKHIQATRYAKLIKASKSTEMSLQKLAMLAVLQKFLLEKELLESEKTPRNFLGGKYEKY